MLKTCPSCKTEKHINNFGKDRTTPSGYKVYCRLCRNEKAKKRCRTKSGLITRIYAHQKDKSRKRGHHQPLYTLHELRMWCFEREEFHRLFKEWEDSGHEKDLVPSVDRLDNSKGYSFDNIQIVTWAINNLLGRQKKNP